MKKNIIIVLFFTLCSALFASDSLSFREFLKGATSADDFAKKINLLEQAILKNNKDAVLEYAKFHIGDATLINFEYFNRVNGANFYNIEGYNQLAKKWGVKQDFEKAKKVLVNATKTGDADAMIILAMLHHKGVCVPKNESIAKEWLNSASEKKSFDARVLYAYYFDTYVRNLVQHTSFLEHIVTDEKLMPKLFNPEKANLGDCAKEKQDENTKEKYKEISDINKTNLISPICIAELYGWDSDNGQGVYMLDPMQSNRFFSDKPICVYGKTVRIATEEAPYRNYREIAKLSNGLHVIEYNERSGGSIGVDSIIMLLGYEKVRQYGNDSPIKVLLKSYGNISLGYSSGMVLCNIEVVGDVIGIHLIEVDMEWENPKVVSMIDFISFEPDINKDVQSREALIKKLLK